MQQDSSYALQPIEPARRPRLSGITRPIHRSHRPIARRVLPADPHPHDVRRGLVDGDRPNVGHRLIVENSPPRLARVRGFPEPTGFGSDINDVRIRYDSIDRGDPACPSRRTEATR